MSKLEKHTCPKCPAVFTDKPHLGLHMQDVHPVGGVTAANTDAATGVRAATDKVSREEIDALLPEMQKSISERSQGDLKALGLWVRETIHILAESNKPFKNCSCDKAVKETCSHQWVAASKGIDANATQFNALFAAQWGTIIPKGQTDRETHILQIAYIRALTLWLQEQKLIVVVPKSFSTTSGKRGAVWYYCYEDKPQSYTTRSVSETEALLQKIADRILSATESK